METILGEFKNAIAYLLAPEHQGKWPLTAETPEFLRNNITYVKNALAIDVTSFEFVGGYLCKNKNFALEMVKMNGLLLKNFSDFQSDLEVVTAAVTNDAQAITFAKVMNSDIILASTKDGIEPELINKLRTMKKANKTEGMNPDELTKLLDNTDFVMKILKQDGAFLEVASDRLRSDKEAVKTALENTLDALDYIIFK